MSSRAVVSFCRSPRRLALVLAALFLATTMGGFHSCSGADGRFSIDFAFGNGELVEKGESATLAVQCLLRHLLP